MSERAKSLKFQLLDRWKAVKRIQLAAARKATVRQRMEVLAYFMMAQPRENFDGNSQAKKSREIWSQIRRAEKRASRAA